MKRLYIITGANGHLGNTIIRILAKGAAKIRGLVLPTDNVEDKDNVQYFKGDVRDIKAWNLCLRKLGTEKWSLSIRQGLWIFQKRYLRFYMMNVKGTKNILRLCKEHKVKRLVYVSSVHAIPEKDKSCVLEEVDNFSPDAVEGGYAKTKAEATQAVLMPLLRAWMRLLSIHQNTRPL